ncbi:MAG: hypothetical protein WB930_04440 [Syntrophobacteraceae bacterium]
MIFVARFLLSDNPGRVLPDQGVGSEQRQLVGQGLADQHPVKGGLVQVRQPGQHQDSFPTPGAKDRYRGLSPLGLQSGPEAREAAGAPGTYLPVISQAETLLK